jgi:DNA-binding MarR family transcriptional regulator
VERGGRTKQATAELAGHLLVRGHVTLAPDRADRRAKLYSPTESGLALLAAAADVVADYESWLDRMLGQNAIAQLRHSLATIVEDRHQTHVPLRTPGPSSPAQ